MNIYAHIFYNALSVTSDPQTQFGMGQFVYICRLCYTTGISIISDNLCNSETADLSLSEHHTSKSQ